MHWSLILLTVVMTVVVVGLIALFIVTMTKRRNNLDRLADEPAFPEFRLNAQDWKDVSPGELPDYFTEYERQLAQMETPELENELNRVVRLVRDPDTEQRQEDDQRARQLLSTLSQNASNAGNEAGRVSEGDGIVICAGGFQYGSSAYVLIRQLRELGCTLPIEVWHHNDEMSDSFQTFLESTCGPLQVRNIDQVASIERPHSPFAIKPLAMYYSAFQRVLLLDADNCVVRDPTFLFDHLDKDTPALFWPHHWKMNTKALCWNVLSAQQREKLNYPWGQDSGQLLVDKQYCHKALTLCRTINMHMSSQLGRMFPEPCNKGDRDTWNFSWLATDTPFRMVTERTGGAGVLDDAGQYIGTTVVQYFEDEPLFLHKMWAKWGNQSIRPQWTRVLRFLDDKRGSVDPWNHRFEQAPVVSDPFIKHYPELENQCWEHLNHLRHQSWFQAEFHQQMKDLRLSEA